ncbi:MAG TPA: hypothetical protein VM369_00005, partial [Candidatus Binatia bacterium]|nr:hypothetical protein [Candidatus Binatia bacterium]
AAEPAAMAPVSRSEGGMGGRLALRASIGYGVYDAERESTGFEDTAKSPTYGLGTTFAMNFTPMFGAFADVGIDYSEVKDGVNPFWAGTGNGNFVRTDLTTTVGARLISVLQPFVGYRRAWQDASTPFDQDVWSERGTYAGLGVGPFPIGRPLRRSFSGAYNWSKVHNPPIFGGGFFDYNGASAKLRLGLANSPHALELRYQRFDADGPGTPDTTESYTYLVYVFTLNVLKM